MDWQLTCRVCLETGDMVSLFDWDENNEQLSDKYTYCCGIEVSKNDSLPTLICLNCVDRLTFAYQFKQQCLTSNDTLKECLEEFERSSKAVSGANTSKVTETETITIKQENGLLLQYELPVEHDPQIPWSNKALYDHNPISGAVVTKAPGPRKRGRPRKYPNEQGEIDVSPYQRKKPKAQKEEESLTSLLASGSLELKQEPTEDELDDEPFGGDFPDDDPDFAPELEEEEKKTTPKKRGRPPKAKEAKKKKDDQESEDVLLKETILAFSEPIPEHILNPKPKKKTQYKKRYNYEKTHTCETCGASFTSNASLQAHIRRHLGIKPFVCSVCGYLGASSSNLRAHMLRHTGEKNLKCRHCDRTFYEHTDRNRHESVCGFMATCNSNLRAHMLRHTGEKRLKCRHCDRTFYEQTDRNRHESVCDYMGSCSSNLKRHMRRLHTFEKRLKCRHCERTFYEQTDRNRHESVCGYSCVMNEELKRHMLRHTGEKPYKCRICDRRFGDYGTRQKHERLHMGIRPYQCSLCGKSFTYSYVLSNHMLTHTGEKKYSCGPCNKKFTKAHHLKYHNKVHHKELYMQQVEAQAKKMKQQNLSLSGVLSGQIVNGKLQLIQGTSEDGEQEGQMQVVEERDEQDDVDSEEKETHRAVADMQVVLDSDFVIGGDDSQS